MGEASDAGRSQWRELELRANAKRRMLTSTAHRIIKMSTIDGIGHASTAELLRRLQATPTERNPTGQASHQVALNNRSRQALHRDLQSRISPLIDANGKIDLEDAVSVFVDTLLSWEFGPRGLTHGDMLRIKKQTQKLLLQCESQRDRIEKILLKIGHPT